MKAENRTYTVKHIQFVDFTAQWKCHSSVAVPWCKPGGFHWEWLQLTVAVTLRGGRVGMSAWLGCWWHWNFASVSSWQGLCAISCSQSQALSFLLVAPSSTHFFSPLTLHLSTFSCSADTSSNSSSFALPSSHPPTSCPILLQIWGFGHGFPSEPSLHSFLCFLKCWARFADFLLLPDWWREPAQECPRSSGHMKNVTNDSRWKRADKAQAPAEGWGWVKWFWLKHKPDRWHNSEGKHFTLRADWNQDGEESRVNLANVDSADAPRGVR